MSRRYTVETAGAQALGAGVPETILSIVAPVGLVYRLAEFSVSFDGITAAAVPVLVELMASTQATTGSSTAHTPLQTEGAVVAVVATAARGFTVEPTVLSVLKPWLVDPNKGILIVQNPLVREFQRNATPRAMVLRCTAPAGVNVRGYMEWEEE